MDKLVIGLIGEKGAGKQTFNDSLQKILKNNKIQVVKSGEMPLEALNFWDLPNTRANLQNLAIIMDQTYGEGTVSRAVKTKIANSEANIIIFDGIRWQTDIDVVRQFSRNILIYITAKAKLRYQRLKERQEKADEKTLTWEQFLKEERAKTETFIPIISKQADIMLDNNGSIEDLGTQIEKVVKNHSLDI